MIEIGTLAIYLALATCLCAIAMSIAGAQRSRRRMIASGEHAAYATWGLVLVAVGVMLHALLTNDFRLKYVAEYSSTTLPLRYKITSLWGGMEGSLLFWVLLLTTFIAIAQYQNRERNRDLMPYVTATSCTVAAFFLSLLAFVTPPFGFAIAALVTGRVDDLWIRTSRRWCLMAWFFLSLGNLFGARWAYEVLGWGGYWAWDP